MLIHADYFSTMRPRVRVFTNRIEFGNPGAFPLPISEFMKKDISLPQNPVLAKLFRSVKLAENAGLGFDKMLKWETETNTKIEFDSNLSYSILTFQLPFTSDLTENNHTESNRKTVEKTVEKTDKIDNEILQLMANNMHIQISEISKKIERGISVTNERIAKLKKLGLLERTGPDKDGYWKIIHNCAC